MVKILSKKLLKLKRMNKKGKKTKGSKRFYTATNRLNALFRNGWQFADLIHEQGRREGDKVIETGGQTSRYTISFAVPYEDNKLKPDLNGRRREFHLTDHLNDPDVKTLHRDLQIIGQLTYCTLRDSMNRICPGEAEPEVDSTDNYDFTQKDLQQLVDKTLMAVHGDANPWARLGEKQLKAQKEALDAFSRDITEATNKNITGKKTKKTKGKKAKKAMKWRLHARRLRAQFCARTPPATCLLPSNTCVGPHPRGHRPPPPILSTGTGCTSSTATATSRTHVPTPRRATPRRRTGSSTGTPPGLHLSPVTRTTSRTSGAGTVDSSGSTR